jgi:hypothetical protein
MDELIVLWFGLAAVALLLLIPLFLMLMFGVG